MSLDPDEAVAMYTKLIAKCERAIHLYAVRAEEDRAKLSVLQSELAKWQTRLEASNATDG